MFDFLIVGNGLAANVLALYFHSEKISYHIIGNAHLSKCSQIAAGIWNPIVFKRMTKSWKADELIPELNAFYLQSEKLLNASFYKSRQIIKPFFSPEEKIFWKKKSESTLGNYIDLGDSLADADQSQFIIPENYGVVSQAGNIDVAQFLSACIKFNEPNKAITSETFDYTQLKIERNLVSYKNLKAKNIIFCEGYLVKNNPFFSWIPLNPVKGEVIEIDCPALNPTSSIYNRNGFIINTNGNNYKVGATYNWSDLTESTTVAGLNELKAKLDLMITAPYSILKHEAGIRPSSIDRRPIIGKHPNKANLYVFNGLGTKGVMIAPFFSKKFVNFFLKNEELDSEINVSRFYSTHFK